MLFLFSYEQTDMNRPGASQLAGVTAAFFIMRRRITSNYTDKFSQNWGNERVRDALRGGFWRA